MACFGISSIASLDYSSRLTCIVSSYKVKLLSIISEGTTGKEL